jgi:hypothetical protein
MLQLGARVATHQVDVVVLEQPREVQCEAAAEAARGAGHEYGGGEHSKAATKQVSPDLPRGFVNRGLIHSKSVTISPISSFAENH